jgi:hypothetical protein
MGFTAAVDHQNRRVRAEAGGPITFEEVQRHLVEEKASGGLPYPEVIDARAAEVQFSPAEVRTIVGILREFRKTTSIGPTAIIVSTDLGYGMLRMLEILVADICRIRPFRKLEDAELWLREEPGNDEGINDEVLKVRV